LELFSCSCEPDGSGSVLLRLVGELDLASEEIFRAALRSAEDSGFVVLVDLTALDFIDCASLGRLAATATRMKQAGKKLILLGGSGQVDRLLVLAGEPRDAERRRHDPRLELVVGGIEGAVAAWVSGGTSAP
jgi:anti-anti-sigma factor